MMLEMKHDQQTIKRHHFLLLFKCVLRHGPISRADLAKMTQMSATSASRIVKELIDEQLIVEVGQTEGNIGRRATLLEVNSKGALMLGVHMEKGRIESGVVDLNGSVLAHESVRVPARTTPQEMMEVAAKLMLNLQKQYDHETPKWLGCGISIPGIVDWPHGRVMNVPQFQWGKVDLGTYLEERLNMPVYVDNQVKAILMGEVLYGSAVGVESAACIYVDSGLGGAFMDKGNVIRGVSNIAGEIGHTTIDPYGMLCDCGRNGCLQTYICTSALEKQSGKSIDEIFAAMDRGEDWAVRLLDRASEYLAMAISNVACTYNPEVILLAGAMMQFHKKWTKDVQQKVKKYLWNEVIQRVSIQHVSNPMVEMIGASSLVMRQFLEPRN